ncbi:unnamed protein product [Dicrocoelium dendriticum]|nr:unnamed protein product [Dicrocoelium dendriticum]
MSHRRESGAVPPWVIPESMGRRPNSVSDVHSGAKNSPNRDLSLLHKDTSPGTTDGKLVNITPGLTCETDDFNSQNRYLHIVGGEIVNCDCIQQANLLIENGKVIAVGKRMDVPKSTPTIDATGFLIMPGGVDISTYILNDAFGFEPNDYSNTTREAVLGGTTTIIDTVICPQGHMPVDVLCRQKIRANKHKIWCNVAYRMGLMEINDAILEQFEALVKNHGVNSFLFFASSGGSTGQITPAKLRMALQKCRQLGALATIRNATTSSSGKAAAEPPTNTEDTELGTVETALQSAQATNCPILVASISRPLAMDHIVQARRQIPPVHVFVSCTPSTLLPSSTGDGDCPRKLIAHLAAGDITCVSSDQAGTNTAAGSARLGVVGQRLVAVWEAGVPSGWLDATSFVSVISTNAARYTGLYPRKGRIGPGSDADLVMWPVNSVSQMGTGRPTMVLLQGEVVAREGKPIDKMNDVGPFVTVDGIPSEVVDPEPKGTVLNCEPFPSSVYGPVMATDRLRRRLQPAMEKGPWSMGSLTKELGTRAPTSAKSGGALDHSGLSTEQIHAPRSPELQETLGVRMIHGHRDLHASGFSLSGAQVDDHQPQRSGIRTMQPPGGQPRNPLW